MSEFLIKQCPVCNEHNFKTKLTTYDFFVTGEAFHIGQCISCGLLFTSNAKDEEQIGRYYRSEKYISHSNTGKGLVNAAYHLIRRYMLKRKKRLITKVSEVEKGSILDVGTGTGYFLNQMKKAGWSVTGTEKSIDARTFVERKFRIRLFPDNELFGIEDQQYDVITLWHVLEHIHRIEENMAAFHRLLKKKGKLIIAVPNPSSFDARRYGKYWAAWDVPRHLWHFTPVQMGQLGEKFGFSLASMYNLPFDSFYVSILSEKYKKSKFALFKGLFFGQLSWLISLTAPGRGSSVIYVFEKKD